jgi:hypothetical protein
MLGDDAFETEDGKARGILPKYCPDGYISLLWLGSDFLIRNLVTQQPRMITDAF